MGCFGIAYDYDYTIEYASAYIQQYEYRLSMGWTPTPEAQETEERLRKELDAALEKRANETCDSY